MSRKRLLIIAIPVLLIVMVVLIWVNKNNAEPDFLSSEKIADIIRDIEKECVTYLEVKNTSDSVMNSSVKEIVVRVILSGIGCSVCFEELVTTLNSIADSSGDKMLCLVITNPDRNSAFQLKRMYGIRIPLYVTDDERLKAIGKGMGSAYIFSENSARPLFNLKPVRSADDIIRYVLE